MEPRANPYGDMNAGTRGYSQTASSKKANQMRPVKRSWCLGSTSDWSPALILSIQPPLLRRQRRLSPPDCEWWTRGGERKKVKKYTQGTLLSRWITKPNYSTRQSSVFVKPTFGTTSVRKEKNTFFPISMTNKLRLDFTFKLYKSFWVKRVRVIARGNFLYLNGQWYGVGLNDKSSWVFFLI